MKSLCIKPKKLLLKDGVCNEYTKILAKKHNIKELVDTNNSQ